MIRLDIYYIHYCNRIILIVIVVQSPPLYPDDECCIHSKYRDSNLIFLINYN